LIQDAVKLIELFRALSKKGKRGEGVRTCPSSRQAPSTGWEKIGWKKYQNLNKHRGEGVRKKQKGWFLGNVSMQGVLGWTVNTKKKNLEERKERIRKPKHTPAKQGMIYHYRGGGRGR